MGFVFQRNLGDSPCPMLVIQGLQVALREMGSQGTSLLVGFRKTS